jgi:hypothetical protein
VLDRALRARPRDEALRGLIVRFLSNGANDLGLFADLRRAGEAFAALEAESERLSRTYRVEGPLAICDATTRHAPYEKTLLLMLGQEKATISVVHDETTVTIAARFDSGVDLLSALGLEGGMPTRVSVPAKELDDVLGRLRAHFSE